MRATEAVCSEDVWVRLVMVSWIVLVYVQAADGGRLKCIGSVGSWRIAIWLFDSDIVRAGKLNP